MGCAPSKSERENGDAYSKENVKLLNKQLSEKARHPSAIPSSFYEREHRFRQQQHPKRAVPERRQGACRMRVGTWGTWQEGCCVLAGHSLQFFPGAPAEGPPPAAKPAHSWELVGAHLRMEKKQELGLTPAGGSAAVSFSMPDERQAQEWMVGLAAVPGLFRRVPDYYDLGAAWGQGATCIVRECVGRYSGERYALKSRLHKSRAATEAMHNELRILQICAKHPHPAIPCLYNYFFDDDGSIELVTDLMEGGELFDHIAAVQQLREHDARAIFQQVAEGVAHLHSLGIAHRDLKPQNLMYVSADEGAQVKVMDYDLAKVNYAERWEGGTPCGTIYYMAPEIVRHQRYSQAVDMWSLGVILFILLTGRMPFDGKTNEEIAKAIDSGRYSMDHRLWGGVSQEAKDLVRCLLQSDPQQRLTAPQVLEHAWLKADLHPTQSAELASPVQLRNSLSKTERGRKLLALTALAYSESDSRLPIGATAGSGIPRLPKLGRGSAGNGLVSAAAQLLDFDMQPVRDQAGGSSGGMRTVAAVGSVANGGAGGDDAALSKLRSQLQMVGTAGGLQDRGYLELQGEELLGASPRSPRPEQPPDYCETAGSGALAWSRSAATQHGRAQQQQQQRQPTDGFADLEAEEVEEQDLGGSSSEEDEAEGSRQSTQHGSSDAVVAAAARQQQAAPGLLPLQVRLPPEHMLPADRLLLERVASGGKAVVQGMPLSGRAQKAALAAGMKRVQSAYEAGSIDSMQRSTSASLLDNRGARIPAAQREPVQRAMEQKQQRLASIHHASASGLQWQQMEAALPAQSPEL
ncbi:hypothetical protein D9Q98_003377 [Chlorella vulgaris]|uniref:Protein kinase domain-containing protein n=1 Tax=Chlorella vulgaris TaxID=3077 RepID=A0A9D4TSI0_CHLVU|nr:hypothetical protein D9Q98_003377 [Chlorella vulgaris]